MVEYWWDMLPFPPLTPLGLNGKPPDTIGRNIQWVNKKWSTDETHDLTTTYSNYKRLFYVSPGFVDKGWKYL